MGVSLHNKPIFPLQCSDDVEVRNNDHLLFITLSTLIKIFKECGVVRDSKWTEQVNTIWGKPVLHDGLLLVYHEAVLVNVHVVSIMIESSLTIS